MAVSHGFGKIVTDGLVLALDAADTNSYTSGSTTWGDMSGNGYNGTLTNGPTFDSANGGSIVFDGVNDYVTILGDGGDDDVHAWTADGTIGSSILCMETWVKIPVSDTAGWIISKPWNSIGRYNIRVTYNYFNLTVGTDTPGGNDQQKLLYFSNYLNSNTWRHLVVWANSTTMGYYIDGGTYKGSVTHSLTGGISDKGNSNLPLGLMTLYFYGNGWAGNTGFSVEGNVGIFRKYNRVLTDSEVLQNYNTLKPRFGL